MHAVSLAVVLGTLTSSAFVLGSHAHFGNRHIHHHHQKKAKVGVEFDKRDQKVCEFPKDSGLVEVTPIMENADWAMAPDTACAPGMYCPYACPPGQLMGQWDPKATSYTYPQVMNGGLYCNEDGEIEKPFSEKGYCYDGVGTVQCQNKAKKSVAFCQTVLPRNEAMVIPTNVQKETVLAVPDEHYWASTAAHYYINPPGISTEEGCVWGSRDKPIGNWSPYVAGVNKDKTGNTFVKLGWNPIYIEPEVKFRDVVPDWGVRIECEGCTGLPCEIDPNVYKVNEITSGAGPSDPGAGGAVFCVVGVPEDAIARIVIFDQDGGETGDIDIKGSEESQQQETPKKPDQSESIYNDVKLYVAPPPSQTAGPSETATSPSSTYSWVESAPPTVYNSFENARSMVTYTTYSDTEIGGIVSTTHSSSAYHTNTPKNATVDAPVFPPTVPSFAASILKFPVATVALALVGFFF